MAPFTAFTTVGKYHLQFVVLSKDQRTERGDNARAARLSAIERSANLEARRPLRLEITPERHAMSEGLPSKTRADAMAQFWRAT